MLILAAVLTGGASVQATEKPRIEVRKSERTLVLYQGDEVVKSYPVGLGFSPTGDKEKEGDGATPEGEYTVCVKNPQSRYYLSVGLSYPGKADADRGLEAGLISEAEHHQILEAEAAGRCPPWNTALGGEIYVHGHGSSSDWTRGCVALEDPDMRQLFDAVRIGTPVTIRP